MKPMSEMIEELVNSGLGEEMTPPLRRRACVFPRANAAPEHMRHGRLCIGAPGIGIAQLFVQHAA
jgi:hypothetical protein